MEKLRTACSLSSFGSSPTDGKLCTTTHQRRIEMLMAFGGAAAPRTIAFRNDRLRKNDSWKKRGERVLGKGTTSVVPLSPHKHWASVREGCSCPQLNRESYPLTLSRAPARACPPAASH